MQVCVTTLRADYRVAEPFRLPHHAGGLWHGVLGRALLAEGCPEPARHENDAVPHHCAYEQLTRPGPELIPAAARDPLRAIETLVQEALSRAEEPSSPTSEAPPSVTDGDARGAPRALPVPLGDRDAHEQGSLFNARGGRRALPVPQCFVPVLPPPGARPLEAGDHLALELELFGPSTPDRTALLRGALARVESLTLGSPRDRRGRVELQGLAYVGPRDELLTIEPGHSGWIELELTHRTPANLRHHGKLLARPTLLHYVARALERTARVAACYGDLKSEDVNAAEHLLRLAKQGRRLRANLREARWNRLSERAERRHPLEGLTGTIVFEGPLRPLLPLFRAAHHLHLGKGTAFGLGALDLQPRNKPEPRQPSPRNA